MIILRPVQIADSEIVRIVLIYVELEDTQRLIQSLCEYKQARREDIGDVMLDLKDRRGELEREVLYIFIQQPSHTRSYLKLSPDLKQWYDAILH